MPVRDRPAGPPAAAIRPADRGIGRATSPVGVPRTVPELGLPVLDADRIDASGEAYCLLNTPGSLLGIIAGTGALAAPTRLRR